MAELADALDTTCPQRYAIIQKTRSGESQIARRSRKRYQADLLIVECDAHKLAVEGLNLDSVFGSLSTTIFSWEADRHIIEGFNGGLAGAKSQGKPIMLA